MGIEKGNYELLKNLCKLRDFTTLNDAKDSLFPELAPEANDVFAYSHRIWLQCSVI